MAGRGRLEGDPAQAGLPSVEQAIPVGVVPYCPADRAGPNMREVGFPHLARRDGDNARVGGIARSRADERYCRSRRHDADRYCRLDNVHPEVAGRQAAEPKRSVRCHHTSRSRRAGDMCQLNARPGQRRLAGIKDAIIVEVNPDRTGHNAFAE